MDFSVKPKKPPPPALTNNIKMEIIPTEIKWKIHALFTLYFTLWSYFFCWCSLNQKGDFQTKTKKANMHVLHAFSAFIQFCIFKLVSVPNFTLNSFEFWDQIFPKSVFLVQNRRSSHHNWIPHIWLSLGFKFIFKLTILISWTKFAQNWYSKKLHFCMCPWSLLTILNLFARWPTDTTTFQCFFSF